MKTDPALIITVTSTITHFSQLILDIWINKTLFFLGEVEGGGINSIVVFSMKFPSRNFQKQESHFFELWLFPLITLQLKGSSGKGRIKEAKFYEM